MAEYARNNFKYAMFLNDWFYSYILLLIVRAKNPSKATEAFSIEKALHAKIHETRNVQSDTGKTDDEMARKYYDLSRTRTHDYLSENL